jgi:hypothetical protein
MTSTGATDVAAPARSQNSFLSDGTAIVWAIALAKLVLHIYFNNRYGYFRYEFDYISRRARRLVRSVRFIPAFVFSLLVVQTAVLTR